MLFYLIIKKYLLHRLKVVICMYMCYKKNVSVLAGAATQHDVLLLQYDFLILYDSFENMRFSNSLKKKEILLYSAFIKKNTAFILLNFLFQARNYINGKTRKLHFYIS